MKNDFDMNEVYARADKLRSTNSTVEKAAKYMNAEFNMCFYAVKKTLWFSWMEGSQEQRRAIGTFA